MKIGNSFRVTAQKPGCYSNVSTVSLDLSWKETDRETINLHGKTGLVTNFVPFQKEKYS